MNRYNILQTLPQEQKKLPSVLNNAECSALRDMCSWQRLLKLAAYEILLGVFYSNDKISREALYLAMSIFDRYLVVNEKGILECLENGSTESLK